MRIKLHIGKYILYLVYIVFLFAYVSTTSAQSKKTTGLSDEVMAWTVSTMELWPEGRYKSLREAMIDNEFFIPLVFRGGMFPEINYQFSRDSISLTPPLRPPFVYRNKRSENMFKYYYFKKALEDHAYKNVMLKDPRNFKYTLSRLPQRVIRPERIDRSAEPVKLEAKTQIAPPETVDPVIKFIPDRKYWTSSFSSDIKFSQNKTSSNWFKGEIDNMNIFTNAVITYNYARDKISLANTLSATFTINSAPKDTLRDYSIGTDELRLRSVLGLKAIKNWNYSTSAEFVTSMGNRYIANTMNKNSAFLAPYTINLGIGMTYAVTPKFKKPDRAMNVALTINPFSFKYMYSIDREINLPAYFPKNEDGTYMFVLSTFGSQVTMNSTVKFNKSINLTSRLDYFTNYELVKCELENKLDIAISRYFSTTFYLYLRFDDSVAKSPTSDTYLQYNELFSFGFSYRW
ncbi:MAG: DUF3078 domain-containing protein [Tannerella sp.]|nr:DUF3078 domain-containing protein [Tannerella sp.]